MYEIRSVPEPEALALQRRLSLPDCDPDTGRHHDEHLATRLGAWTPEGLLVGLIRLLPLDEKGQLDERVRRVDGPFALQGHQGCKPALEAKIQALRDDGAAIWRPYSAETIQVLSGVQAVRKRPGMYIGSVDVDGELEVAWEPVGNVLDEHLAGHASVLRIDHDPAEQVWTVSDDGRGVPIGAIERVMTSLHAGAHQGAPRYHVHAGLHGLGLAVLCALSETCSLTSERDGGRVTMRFARGVPTSPLTPEPVTGQRGTTLRFRLDREIFQVLGLDTDNKTLRRRIWELSCFNPGLDIRVQGARAVAPDGLRSLAEGHAGEPLVDVVSFQDEVDGVRVRGLLGWRASRQGAPLAVGYCNQSQTRAGGSHIDGAQAALAGVAEPGRVLLLNVDVLEVLYAGRTRDKLFNPEVEPIVTRVLSRALA